MENLWKSIQNHIILTWKFTDRFEFTDSIVFESREEKKRIFKFHYAQEMNRKWNMFVDFMSGAKSEWINAYEVEGFSTFWACTEYGHHEWTASWRNWYSGEEYRSLSEDEHQATFAVVTAEALIYS